LGLSDDLHPRDNNKHETQLPNNTVSRNRRKKKAVSQKTVNTISKTGCGKYSKGLCLITYRGMDSMHMVNQRTGSDVLMLPVGQSTLYTRTVRCPTEPITNIFTCILMFNPLKTKHMFYIRIQCVPRCKHSPLRL
jgi:hypothetical protein